MTTTDFATQLEQLLHDSQKFLCHEIHDTDAGVALAYARSLWSIEDALRKLAAHITEGNVA